MDELGLLMATAEKRQCGQHLTWNGTGIASQLAIGWIVKPKLLSSTAAIISALDGTLCFADYHSLLGLLEHFAFNSSLRRNRMYGLWHPCRQSTTPEPGSLIRLTVLMRKQLNRWLNFLRTNAGISALGAIPKQVAAQAASQISSSTVFTANNDAATDKVVAGLGGWCHGLWRTCRCTLTEARIPIVVLKIIVALVTFFTVAPLLGDPNKTTHRLHLRIDALSSPQILADDCAHAEMLEELHLKACNTKLWQLWAPHLILSHLHGIGNEFAYAASREDFDRLARLAAQVKASPKQSTPDSVLQVLLAIAVRPLTTAELYIAPGQSNLPTKALFAVSPLLGLEDDLLMLALGDLPITQAWDECSMLTFTAAELQLSSCGLRALLFASAGPVRNSSSLLYFMLLLPADAMASSSCARIVWFIDMVLAIKSQAEALRSAAALCSTTRSQPGLCQRVTTG